MQPYGNRNKRRKAKNFSPFVLFLQPVIRQLVLHMKKSLIALAFGTLALGMSEFVMMGILPDIARSLVQLAVVFGAVAVNIGRILVDEDIAEELDPHVRITHGTVARNDSAVMLRGEIADQEDHRVAGGYGAHVVRLQVDEFLLGLGLLDSIANQIRKDSLSFDKAALQFSDDATSKMNGGIVSNHDILERFNAFEAKLTVTKFLREDFAHFGALDDYNALIRLKPGEISPAFLTEDIMGNQLAKIVKLVEIIPTHVASLNEDYLRLEEMALNAKQERVFKEWLTKKIDAMYVYIAPEFRDGEFENKSWVK